MDRTDTVVVSSFVCATMYLMNGITIQKSKVEKQKGVVILSLKEYQKLLEQAVPTSYLTGKEAKKLDKLVEEGLREHHAGKTIKAKSLTEALTIYGKKRNR